MILLLTADFFRNNLRKNNQEHCVKCLDLGQDRCFIVSNQVEESVSVKWFKNFTMSAIIVSVRFLNSWRHL